MKDIVKYGAARWNLLTEIDREPYKLQAEVDRLRYERDKLTYEGGCATKIQELTLAMLNLGNKINMVHKPLMIINFS